MSVQGKISDYYLPCPALAYDCGHKLPLGKSNGVRLSCGALKKKVSFNILRAPPASSACWTAGLGLCADSAHQFTGSSRWCGSPEVLSTAPLIGPPRAGLRLRRIEDLSSGLGL